MKRTLAIVGGFLLVIAAVSWSLAGTPPNYGGGGGGGAVSPLVLTAHNDAEVPLRLNANSATQTGDFLSAYDAVAGNQVFGMNNQTGMFFYPGNFSPIAGQTAQGFDLEPSGAATVASPLSVLLGVYVNPILTSTEAGSLTTRVSGLQLDTRRDGGSGDAGTVTNQEGIFAFYGNQSINASAVSSNCYGLHLNPYSQTGTVSNLVDIQIEAPVTGGTLTSHKAINQIDTASLCTNFLGAATQFGTYFTVPKTIAGSGTTGDQTQNTQSGRVRIAASGTTVTVTNSLVTANSIVVCTVGSNDATAAVKNCVPGNGSFVITLTAAATSETPINWMVMP